MNLGREIAELSAGEERRCVAQAVHRAYLVSRFGFEVSGFRSQLFEV